MIHSDSNCKENILYINKKIADGLCGNFRLPVRTINIALTNKCNLHCKICYLCSPDFENKTYNNETPFALSFEKYKNTFSKEWFQKHSINGKSHAITFVHGEPFLVPEIYNILAYTRTMLPRAYMSVVTNGTIPLSVLKKQQEKSNICSDSLAQILSLISFSFDGYKSSTFESIRTPAKYKNVYRNILEWVKEREQFAPNKNVFRFGVALSKRNINELPDIIKLAGKLGGFSGVYVQPLVNPKHVKELEEWMLENIKKEKGQRAIQKAYKLGEKYSLNVVIEDAILELFGIADPMEEIAEDDNKSARFCDGLWDGKLIIKTDGSLESLCCRFTGGRSAELMERYNIPLNIDAIDAYNSPEYWLLRKDFLEGKDDLLDSCIGCDHGKYAYKKFCRTTK